MKVAYLYEHPTWSDKLIDCFGQNDIELSLINVDGLAFNTGDLKPGYDLLINRVNIMPYEKSDSSVVFHTLHYLNWVELSGVRVINGARSHYIGASKAMQNGIFSRLGLDFPRAVAIHDARDALKAADTIGYPLIVKPNIGGSGSGISRFDSADELQTVIDDQSLQLGIDRSGLVQEYIQSDGYVYRVEVLGDQLFYSIKQKIIADQFNYCAADGCSVDGLHPDQEKEFDFNAAVAVSQVEVFDVSPEILQQVIRIVKSSDADVGGVEYFLNSKTGQPCFYDFNPYSNFVSHGEALLGFSPEQHYVDFIKLQIARIDTPQVA